MKGGFGPVMQCSHAVVRVDMQTPRHTVAPSDSEPRVLNTENRTLKTLFCNSYNRAEKL